MIAYMKYGFAGVGITVVLVALGHVQTPFMRGVGGVLAVYRSQSFVCLMYGGRTLYHAVVLGVSQRLAAKVPS